MMAMPYELLRVAPQVPVQESRHTELVPLAYVDKLVGQQPASAIVIGVGAQQHESAEGHARGPGGEQRHLDDADALGE